MYQFYKIKSNGPVDEEMCFQEKLIFLRNLCFQEISEISEFSRISILRENHDFQDFKESVNHSIYLKIKEYSNSWINSNWTILYILTGNLLRKVPKIAIQQGQVVKWCFSPKTAKIRPKQPNQLKLEVSIFICLISPK